MAAWCVLGSVFFGFLSVRELLHHLLAAIGFAMKEGSIGPFLCLCREGQGMAEVGSDALGWSSPRQLCGQAHLSEGNVCLNCKFTQSGDGTASLSQLCHCLAVKVLPYVQMEFLMDQFLPISSCPATGHC